MENIALLVTLRQEICAKLTVFPKRRLCRILQMEAPDSNRNRRFIV